MAAIIGPTRSCATCKQEFGCETVTHVALEDWATRGESWQSHRTRNPSARVRQRLARMTENPYNLLTRDGMVAHARGSARGACCHANSANRYVAQVLRRGIRSAWSIIRCWIRSGDQRAGGRADAHHQPQPRIAGRRRLQFASRVATQRAGVDFGNELWSLSHFDARLAISRVEAAVLNGVGLAASSIHTCQAARCGAAPRTRCSAIGTRHGPEALPADGHGVSRADAAVDGVVRGARGALRGCHSRARGARRQPRGRAGAARTHDSGAGSARQEFRMRSWRSCWCRRERRWCRSAWASAR